MKNKINAWILLIGISAGVCLGLSIDLPINFLKGAFLTTGSFLMALFVNKIMEDVVKNDY